MYGTPRLAELVAGGEELIGGLLTSLDELHRLRLGAGGRHHARHAPPQRGRRARPPVALEEAFRIASRPGNEREAMERVAAVVAPLGLEPRRLEQLETAVAEAAMNAIEHGNEGREELPVEVEVAVADGASSSGSPTRASAGRSARPRRRTSTRKLAGLQKPRGWGLFLIENMVDELRVSDADGRHTVELVLNLEGGGADGDR